MGRPVNKVAAVVAADHFISSEDINQLSETVRRRALAILEDQDSSANVEDTRSIYLAETSRVFADYCSRTLTNGEFDLDSSHRAAAQLEIVDLAMGQMMLNKVRRLGKHGASDVFLKGIEKTIVHYRNGKREVLAPWFENVSKMGETLRDLRPVHGLPSSPFDPHHPFFDARLPDGIRVNAAHTASGYEVSFRIPNRSITNLNDLLLNGTIEPKVKRFLEGALDAKLNIIIAGGTGAGKTALMLCMLGHLSQNERVVTIEDKVELDLATLHPHIDVVEMEAKDANSEGIGAVSTRAVFRNALRMHPDRIIVGEVRDEIARDLLQAMGTGNEGSISTLHARANKMIVDRLIECSGMPPERVADSVRNAVDVFVHIDRFSNGERRITEISQVSRIREADGLVRLIPIFQGGGSTVEADSMSHAKFVSPPTGDVAAKLAAVGWVS